MFLFGGLPRMKGECKMSSIDQLIQYIKNMDDYQRQLVLSFIVTLFDLED